MPTLSGVWVFNNELTLVPNHASSNKNIPISFTSNGLSFTSFNCGSSGTQQLSFWYYGSAPSEAYFYLEYQSYSVGWVADALRTVDFGTIEQEVSQEFYEWFVTNATKQKPEELPGAIITYLDKRTELPDGKTATLPCEGKTMKGDIVIIYGGEEEAPGLITFKVVEYDTIEQEVVREYIRQSQPGMTWKEWCSSDYNPDDTYVTDDDLSFQYVSFQAVGGGFMMITYEDESYVKPSDVITANAVYYYYFTSGGGGSYD